MPMAPPNGELRRLPQSPPHHGTLLFDRQQVEQRFNAAVESTARNSFWIRNRTALSRLVLYSELETGRGLMSSLPTTTSASAIDDWTDGCARWRDHRTNRR